MQSDQGIPEGVEALLGVFRGPLKEVEFPGVSTVVLQDRLQRRRAAFESVEAARRQLSAAEETAQSAHEELMQCVRRGLEYARVFAGDDAELGAVLAGIRLGSGSGVGRGRKRSLSPRPPELLVGDRGLGAWSENELPRGEQPGGEQSNGERSSGEQSNSEQLSGERSSSEQASKAPPAKIKRKPRGEARGLGEPNPSASRDTPGMAVASVD